MSLAIVRSLPRIALGLVLLVAGLLTHLGVKAARVAVELNEAVVTKDRYDAQRNGSGDAIEVGAFVGGG